MNTHGVGFGKNYSYISVVPNKKDKFRDDERFLTDSNGERYSTVGASPSGWGTTGSLAIGVKRSRDAGKDLRDKEVIGLDFPGEEKSTMPEDEVIEALFDAESRFDDNDFDYDMFPGITGSNNSNGFVRGLLDFVGNTPNKVPNSASGWNDPVPESSFDNVETNDELEVDKNGPTR